MDRAFAGATTVILVGYWIWVVAGPEWPKPGELPFTMAMAVVVGSVAIVFLTIGAVVYSLTGKWGCGPK